MNPGLTSCSNNLNLNCRARDVTDGDKFRQNCHKARKGKASVLMKQAIGQGQHICSLNRQMVPNIHLPQGQLHVFIYEDGGYLLNATI